MTRLYHVAADELQEATSPITAGHICAVVGLKHSKTGDTLVGAQLFPRVVLPTLAVPTPVFSVSVEPESSADDDRLTEAFTLYSSVFSLSLNMTRGGVCVGVGIDRLT